MNTSWRQHSTKQQLYGHQPLITKTIKIRRTIHAGHCWRSKDELIIDLLLWTPSQGRAKARRPARTYTQQLCADTECQQTYKLAVFFTFSSPQSILIWFSFKAYEPLLVIQCQILFLDKYQIYDLLTLFVDTHG